MHRLAAALAVVAAMCVTAPLRALLYTIAYPLGAARAPWAGVGAAVVLGLLNGAWALTTLVGPLAGGALVEAVGARGTYAALQAVVLGATVAVWLRARPPRAAGSPLPAGGA